MSSAVEMQHTLDQQQQEADTMPLHTYDLYQTSTLGKRSGQHHDQKQWSSTSWNIGNAFNDVYRSADIDTTPSYPSTYHPFNINTTQQATHSSKRKRGREDVLEVVSSKCRRSGSTESASLATFADELDLVSSAQNLLSTLPELGTLKEVEQILSASDANADGTLCNEVLPLTRGSVEHGKPAAKHISPVPQSHKPETRRTNFRCQPRSYNAQPWTHTSTNFRDCDYGPSGGGRQNVPGMSTTPCQREAPSRCERDEAESIRTKAPDLPAPVPPDHRVKKSKSKRYIPERRATTRSISAARNAAHLSIDLARKDRVHTSLSTESLSFDDALFLAQEEAVNLSDAVDDTFQDAMELDLFNTVDGSIWEPTQDDDLLERLLAATRATEDL